MNRSGLIQNQKWIIERPPDCRYRYSSDICGVSGDAGQEVNKCWVCSMSDTFSSKPRTMMIHLQNTTPTDAAMVRTLWFRYPTFPTKLVRTTVVVGIPSGHQSFREAHIFILIDRILVGSVKVYWTGITSYANQQGSEGEEVEGTSDQEMNNEGNGLVQSAKIVVYEHNE
jgi:hypothetical protein